jgi:hypothetical protein
MRARPGKRRGAEAQGRITQATGFSPWGPLRLTFPHRLKPVGCDGHANDGPSGASAIDLGQQVAEEEDRSGDDDAWRVRQGGVERR